MLENYDYFRGGIVEVLLFSSKITSRSNHLLFPCCGFFISPGFPQLIVMRELQSSSTAHQLLNDENQRVTRTFDTVRACDQCYRCKVRCSGAGQNDCERCLQNSNICTYSLGRPVGKPSKNGRGREPRKKMQPAKRLRSPSNDAEPDSSGVTESLNGQKRRHIESDIQISPVRNQ